MSLAYGMLGSAWGIGIPSIGGVLPVLLAATSFLSVGGQAIRVYKPIVWAFSTGILVLAIQLLLHEMNTEALIEVTAFAHWLVLLIIVQPLSLRPGFLPRFAVVALVIGIASLPFISMRNVGGVMRAWASGTAISNPNALGMWFGFCTVHFIFWGLQCQKFILRVASWTVALGCLYVVTLTVSRAPLLGIALACVVGLRLVLKRGFVPLLSFVLLMSLVYVSGVFDEKISYYAARGAEESGRERLWPAALERILDSPWIGVGLNDIGVRFGSNKFVIPHNGLLHIALGAGILPMICFLGYLARGVIGTLQIMQRFHRGEAALLPPLVVFTLFEIMVLDYTFMSPWTVVVFALAVVKRADSSRELTYGAGG
ncbi:MAG: O-antigen ligase family protein [Nitrospira sp.]|nr:O-antigen ligase family protein [Nitrospira sp.]